MFFLAGGIAAIICTVIEFLCFKKSTKIKGFIGILIKHGIIDLSISLSLLIKVLKYAHFIDTTSYRPRDFIALGLLTLAAGAALIAITAIREKAPFIEYEGFRKNKKGKKHKGAICLGVISVFLVFLACFCYFGTQWSMVSYGKVTADQFLINITSPGGDDADLGVYLSAVEGPLVYVLSITSVFAYLLFSPYKLVIRKKTVFNGIARRVFCFFLSVAMLIGGATYGIKEFGLKDLYYSYFKTSTFIEDNYVEPNDANLVFPEQKRNLIHIYAESLENSFLTKELGGNMDIELMPELTELAYEGYVFSDTDRKFGGPQEAMGTQWSIASMVNQTTGMPMKVPNAPNDYGNEGNFLPGATTLMDILTEQGYEQTVMFGADANFGGLKYLFTNHGNTTVFDLGYARRNGLVPQDYKVWWGFEDDKLYEFAKEELTRMYETGKPFNFMMETADTHTPAGYISPNCPTPYEDQYSNAIAYSTSQIVEFVRWIQEQPFYENTTIVIIGDHLSMATEFYENYGFTEDYDRSTFNLILNPAPNVDVSDESIFHNRLWCNYDVFPTILTAIGVTYDGNMLGLGTNLFSGEKTLIEKLGKDELDTELTMKSEFYNTEILKDANAFENPGETEEETTNN